MDRREFLTARPKTRLTSSTIPRVFRSTSDLTPYSGDWDTRQLVHLLKRTMFGASKADIEYFKAKSLSQTVDELLNPAAALPSPPLREYDPVGATNPDTDILPGTTWVNNYHNDGNINSKRRASLKKWWTGLLVNQDRSIREKMTLFWHNHFATEMVDVGDPQFIYKHHNLLRTNALGNFKALTKAVTIDPAMLVYLNGNNSTAGAPNENYARELQELFVIGKENNPNYTEDDVKSAARVLTGWRTSSPNMSSSFDAGRHDKTNKQFSSFYGNALITGRSGTSAGEQEIDDLLNMLFSKKAEVSKFIVKKIYRWFCYYTIDEKVQANVIDPLAQIFRDSNWEIKPVLSALFKSGHFYDAVNHGCLIKSPVDMVISVCREFNVVFPNADTSYGDAYTMWEYIRNSTATMNQNIGDPPTVAGWAAYYQQPQFHELWINSDTLPKRNRFTDQLIGNGYTRNGFTLKIDPLAFVKTLSNPGNPNQLIEDCLAIIFQVPLSEDSRQSIKKQILLSGQLNDGYWSQAWTDYLANPAVKETPYLTVFNRLKELFKYFLNMAEYQLS